MPSYLDFKASICSKLTINNESCLPWFHVSSKVNIFTQINMPLVFSSRKPGENACFGEISWFRLNCRYRIDLAKRQTGELRLLGGHTKVANEAVKKDHTGVPAGNCRYFKGNSRNFKGNFPWFSRVDSWREFKRNFLWFSPRGQFVTPQSIAFPSSKLKLTKLTHYFFSDHSWDKREFIKTFKQLIDRHSPKKSNIHPKVIKK